jgi:hypothetical protein
VPGYPGYNPDLPTLYVVQLDINALYSWVMMCQPLPVDQFKKRSKTFCRNFDPLAYSTQGDMGFLVQCDLEVPIHLHEYLKDLPPFPHKVNIEMADLSSQQQEFYKDNEHLATNTNREHLLLTLLPKKRYVVFLPMLQQGLKLGIKLVKVHTIWSYRQSCYLKAWIERNIYLRSVAKTVGESNLIKLVLNSFYGFLGLDATKFKDIQLVADAERAQKLIAQHNFCSVKIINEFLCMIEMHKKEVVIKNHLFVNAAILDASKALLYKLVYGFKDNLKDKIQFAYFDTDSFLCEIQTDDLWQTLDNIRIDGEKVMDFSFLPKDHPYYSDALKGKPGLLKDDNMKDNIYSLIHKVVILTKKGYAIKFFDEHDKLKMKGIKRAFLNELDFDQYYECLFEKKVKVVPVHCLRSRNLQMQAVVMNKLALSPACNSRYVLDDCINTLPYGHKDIP